MSEKVVKTVHDLHAQLKHGLDPNVRYETGDTLLIHLVKTISDRPELSNMIQLLTKYGANVNDVDNHGQTAIEHTMIKQKWDAYYTLLNIHLNQLPSIPCSASYIRVVSHTIRYYSTVRDESV